MDVSGFIKGDGQCLSCGLDMLRDFAPFQGPPLKDRSLGGASGIGVVVFEGQQEGKVGIIREGTGIVTRGQRTVAKVTDRPVPGIRGTKLSAGNPTFAPYASGTDYRLRSKRIL